MCFSKHQAAQPPSTHVRELSKCQSVPASNMGIPWLLPPVSTPNSAPVITCLLPPHCPTPVLPIAVSSTIPLHKLKVIEDQAKVRHQRSPVSACGCQTSLRRNPWTSCIHNLLQVSKCLMAPCFSQLNQSPSQWLLPHLGHCCQLRPAQSLLCFTVG